MGGGQLDTAVRHIRQLAGLQQARERSDRQLLDDFCTHHDQLAFTALVRRHGPMVLSVCRHVLRHAQDAEDAFQATFLVLARKAGSLCKGGALACWLHGVAYRMASQAKRNARRRRAYESRAQTGAVPDPAVEAAWQEVQGVLEAEIQRLPEKYRAPFVLCFLEGHSRAEAARELGVKEGTVWSRLAEARKRLQERLTRRGITLSAVLGALAVSEGARAAPPALLRQATVQAAMAYAAGKTAVAAAGSANVAALVEGVSKAMVVGKVKVMLAVALAAGVAAGTGLLAQSGRTDRPGAAQEQERQPATAAAGEKPEAGGEKRVRVDQFGDPLPAEARARLGTVRFRHGNQIASLSFAADGKTLLSHGRDGIRLWDIATGKELSRFPRILEPSMYDRGIYPDGKWAFSPLRKPNGPTMELLQLGTGRHVGQFGENLQFSPDRKTLVGFRQGSNVQLWDVASGRPLHEWMADRGVWSAVFSRDSKLLVTAGNSAIRFWDVATGGQIGEIRCTSDYTHKLAISPDGKLLALSGFAETAERERACVVRIWDVATGKQIQQLVDPCKDYKGGVRGVSAIAFAPDGKTLVSSGPDHFLRLWAVESGQELRRHVLDGHVWALDVSPDGKSVAAADGGNMIRLLDLQSGKDIFDRAGHHHGVSAAAVSPDGRAVVTGSWERSILIWDARTSRVRFRLESDPGPLSLIGMDRSGRMLYAMDDDKSLRLWDVTTGKVLRQVDVGVISNRLIQPAVTADGRMLALGTEKGSLVLLDSATGKTVKRLERQGTEEWWGAAFTPDGRSLAAWTSEHTVHTWNVATGSFVVNLTQHCKVISFGQLPLRNAVNQSNPRCRPPRNDRLEEHGSNFFEFLARIGVLFAAADGCEQLGGTSKGAENPALRHILVGGGGKGKQGTDHGVWKAHVQRDRFGAQIGETVFEILAKRRRGNAFDGDCQNQAMLLISVADIHLLGAKPALKSFFAWPGACWAHVREAYGTQSVRYLNGEVLGKQLGVALFYALSCSGTGELTCRNDGVEQTHPLALRE